MTANITSVTVTFGHGVKREEYGPTKRAEVSLTAAVAENEDGAVTLALLGRLALAKVADLLNAPKPETVVGAETPAVGEQTPPTRRTRGPNKTTGAEPAAGALAPTSAGPAGDGDLVLTDKLPEDEGDDWSSSADDIQVTDQELLSATSKRAGELGARDPIIKLISSFATRTDGAPFKVQEIPQAQRKDYLTKLAALTA